MATPAEKSLAKAACESGFKDFIATVFTGLAQNLHLPNATDAELEDAKRRARNGIQHGMESLRLMLGYIDNAQ